MAAHILKDPGTHAGKTYRPTGPKILSTQEMADIIGKILGRKVLLTRVPDLETYHHVQGHPTLKNPEFCYQNKEWRAEHE